MGTYELNDLYDELLKLNKLMPIYKTKRDMCFNDTNKKHYYRYRALFSKMESRAEFLEHRLYSEL